MTIVKTSAMPALALALAVLAAAPASAALAANDQATGAVAAAPSAQPGNITLAALNAYIWVKGQKQGGVKPKSARQA